MQPSVQTVQDRERIRVDIERRDWLHQEAQRAKAVGLFHRRRPIADTPVEFYLRHRRCFVDNANVWILPASRGYPPAMLAAFGFAREIEPGVLAVDAQNVTGVHITSLRSDGLGKAGTERDKVMIGRSNGSPIWCTPVNDGLGLAIAEGIEDALSVHRATGLGAWAAGSASRLPALADAVPGYVECVTVISDSDDTGRANAEKLARSLQLKSIEVRLVVPAESSEAAA